MQRLRHLNDCYRHHTHTINPERGVVLLATKSFFSYPAGDGMNTASDESGQGITSQISLFPLSAPFYFPLF